MLSYLSEENVISPAIPWIVLGIKVLSRARFGLFRPLIIEAFGLDIEWSVFLGLLHEQLVNAFLLIDKRSVFSLLVC